MRDPLNVTVTRVPKRMGIRMSGCEIPLEDLIRQHTANHGAPDQPYTLIEVGSAGCVTLRAFADILRECGKTKWRVVGFDLPPGKAWSLDMAEVNRSLEGVPHRIAGKGARYLSDDDNKAVVLWLEDDPRAFLASGEDTALRKVDFAFIDGCHGKCAGRDFLALEKHITPGGLVVFHDYGEAEQGTDFQECCREFISVRSYVHRLGLNHPTSKGGLRKGWRWIGEIVGSRTFGGDGNSAAVVQRTNEPLQHQPELSID